MVVRGAGVTFKSDYFLGSIKILGIFSSPEHEVLMVSCCGQSVCVVRRQQLL